MTNTNTTDPALLTACRAAIAGAGDRASYATVQVTLPDGTTGHACATHVLAGVRTGRQDVRVSQGRRVDLWWACQLLLAVGDGTGAGPQLTSDGPNTALEIELAGIAD